ncbi:GH25 family lysozyme [Mesorhizobium sp. ZMM04-4]
MRRYLWGLIGVLLLGCVALGVGYLYLMPFSPDRAAHPLRGIDVSNHQGVIDWKRVAADDVSFAIIKATEGGDWVDRSFSRNMAGAKEAGLAVGAYHFFTFCRAGVEQARNFIATVPRDPSLLPPVVDVEFHGNCPQRPAPETLSMELAAFLEPVEAHFGKPAIIYLAGDAEDLYAAVMPDRLRWVRSLARHPGHEDWVYWQYSDVGRVDGIEGDVDLDVIRGGLSRLTGLTRPAD